MIRTSACGDDYILDSKVQDWLEDQAIDYQFDAWFEVEPLNSYGYGYVVAILHMGRVSDALLFKLTWL